MGKANRKRAKRRNGATALIAALVILAVATVGTTIAFILDDTGSIENVFTPSDVATDVMITDSTNTDDPNPGKTAQVRNISDTEAYIRAAVVFNWVKTDGNGVKHVHADAPVEGTDFTILWNADDNGSGQSSWIRKTYDDGEIIYYYKNTVDPKNGAQYVTDSLFSLFKLKDGVTPPAGYELSFEVVASGIQSTPVSVVQDNWGVVLDDSGNITAVN